jgi:hypothetical protein
MFFGEFEKKSYFRIYTEGCPKKDGIFDDKHHKHQAQEKDKEIEGWFYIYKYIIFFYVLIKTSVFVVRMFF